MSRLLLDDRDYKHYHRGAEGQWVYRCQGLDCIGLPVMVIAIIVIVFVALMILGTCITVSYLRRRKAFKAGIVPARMILNGHYRYTKSSGKETPEKYVLRGLKRIQVPRNREADAAVAAREESCPVCLKAGSELKMWMELECTHQLCKSCFYRLAAKERLHMRCPLCRVYLFVESEEGLTGCCRGPLPGEMEMQVVRASNSERVGAHTMVI